MGVFISSISDFLVKALIETNVSISNELNFSGVYWSVNYIGSLAKFTWTPNYVNPFWVHSLCMGPNVGYTSINLRKIKFIP